MKRALTTAACAGLMAGCGGTAPTLLIREVRLEYRSGSNVLQIGQTLQVMAVARFADGHEEEVTGDCEWTSGNPAVVSVSGGGLITAVGPGQTAVWAVWQRVMGQLGVSVKSS